MIEVKDMTIDDLEQFIEQKLLEVLGDPDAGLHLREDYKTILSERLKKRSKLISHEEVLKQFQ
ncbi:MAG: hypothetical protein ACK415_08035 [Thermodesulfovibrionales bacterium]